LYDTKVLIYVEQCWRYNVLPEVLPYF
jgi:hypothetical protein